MDLDELLKDAAPQVSARTPELQTELDALVLATGSHAVTRRGVGTRAGVAGAAAVALVAITTVASAAGVGPGFDWVPWHTQGGSTCEFRTSAMDEHPSATSGSRPMPSAREVDEAVAAAQHYLATFDYASLDVDKAVRAYEAIAARPGSDQPELGDPGITSDLIEIIAVNSYVGGLADLHLEELGLSPRGVLYGTETRCDQ